MNNFLLNIQKNAFYVLVPVILFFSFSLSYFVKSIILLFLNPQKLEIKKNQNLQVQNLTQPKAVAMYEGIVEGNFVRGKIVVDQPLLGATGQPVEQVPIDDPNTEEMMVTGTIAGHSSFARVAIKEKDKEESEEFSIGRKIQGYTVKTISEHFAVLFKNGLHLKVDVGETIKEAKARHQAEQERKANSKGATETKLVAGQTVIKPISRTDFERMLKNEGEIYKDARFGPNMVDGKIDGYKIYQVAATHIFYQLGARNGDIVRRVNGIPMNNTQKMLELWSNIKNSQVITIDIERKGNILAYEFQIRN
jgi:general secretion pathway protein C